MRTPAGAAPARGKHGPENVAAATLGRSPGERLELLDERTSAQDETNVGLAVASADGTTAPA